MLGNRLFPCSCTYAFGSACSTPKSLISVFTLQQFLFSQFTITFLGLHWIGSAGFGFNITWRFTSWNGSHLSITTSCGLSGNSGSLSTTTLRGGGGSRTPGIVITLLGGASGFGGGASRKTNVSGVPGTSGTWRMIT